MESNSNDQSEDAETTLTQIELDRRRLTNRIESVPWWYLAASTLLGVCIVVSPATASVWTVTIVAAIATIAFSSLERAIHDKTGISVTRPAGRKSLLISIIVGSGFLALFLMSVVFSASGLAAWIVVTGICALVFLPVGLLALDRAMRREIEHAR